MTFNNAPWAIDGARSTAGLAREQTFGTSGGHSGVTRPTDLRVLPLSVPGNGLRITAGSANVVNLYQSSPNQTYVVSNPGVHTVLSADMPAPVPAAGYYLVCVVIGDPEFDQSGHPFMPSGPLAPEDAADYDYVRVVIVPCNSTTTDFEELGLNFPAYALARLEIPSSTSTILSSMIVDVRQLAQPRTLRRVFIGSVSGGGAVTSGTPVLVTDFNPFVEVPPWATHADIIANINAISHIDPACTGNMSVNLGTSLYGPAIYYELSDTAASGERLNFCIASAIDCSSVAGQTKQLAVYATRLSGTGKIEAYGGTSVVYDVQFSERTL